MKGLLIGIVFFATRIFSGEGKIIIVNNPLQDTIVAKYEYITPAKDGEVSILLKRDKTYKYDLLNHIQHFSSSGNWEIKRDTLILTSFFQKTHLPLIIKEDKIKSDTDTLFIDIIRNNNNVVLSDAEVFLNGDTSRSCMPDFGNGCKLKNTKIDSVKIRLSNNVTSDWYGVNVEKFNNLNIKVGSDYVSNSKYIFFDKEKFVLSGNRLYETELKQANVKGKTVYRVRNKRYFFKKIK